MNVTTVDDFHQPNKTQKPSVIALKRRVSKTSKRKQLYMADSAWKKLDQIKTELGWTRARLLDYILQQFLLEKKKVEDYVHNQSGYSSIIPKESTDARWQCGIHFFEDTDEFLAYTVRLKYKITMSNFVEQVLLHPKLKKDFGLTTKEIEAEEEAWLEEFPSKRYTFR